MIFRGQFLSFVKEIHDGVLNEAAESFDAEISITNKEEKAKTGEKSRFVELSEDDLPRDMQNQHHKANNEAYAVYYTVIKHSGHLRT